MPSRPGQLTAFFFKSRDIKFSILTMGDHAVGGPRFPDIVGEAAGIDAGDAHETTGFQPIIQRPDKRANSPGR